MQRRGKLQRLRSKWGHVRHGVTNRVATTISNIRDKSYAYAGFPMAQPLGSQDESSDPVDLCRARYRQLRNTIVRCVRICQQRRVEMASCCGVSSTACPLLVWSVGQCWGSACCLLWLAY
jgi:hypothetical protein